MSFLSNAVKYVGYANPATALGTAALDLSNAPTKVANPNYNLIPGVDNPFNNGGNQPASTQGPGILARPAGGTSTTQQGSDAYRAQATGGGSGTATSAAELGLYQNQLNDLNSLLGRTDTGLNQGLSSLNDSYRSSVNAKNNELAQANQDYADKRVETNKDKLGAYNTINKNANNGYRSLAQIIGRASGTGSSAFQDLLPEVVGKDISGKRGEANTTYAQNLGGIDNAQKKTELSFQNILADLENQRRTQEQSLRTGVESQKQSILQQQQTAAANLAAARGGNAATAAAAYQPGIENSRNSVESFFNQFKPTVTAQQAAIAAPDLAGYQVDRSNVNAQAQGASDPTNPYADILRKKLQDQAV